MNCLIRISISSKNQFTKVKESADKFHQNGNDFACYRLPHMRLTYHRNRWLWSTVICRNRFRSRGSDYFSGFQGFRLGQLTSSLMQSLGYPPMRPPWRSGSSGHPWPLDHRLCTGFGKLSYDGNPMKTSKSRTLFDNPVQAITWISSAPYMQYKTVQSIIRQLNK